MNENESVGRKSALRMAQEVVHSKSHRRTKCLADEIGHEERIKALCEREKQRGKLTRKGRLRGG